MARKVAKLSPARVAALVKAGRPGLYGDGAGLALRIGRQGAASWALRYMRQGAAREMGLGPVHTIGLAEARERARRHRQELLDGIDPLAQRVAAKAAAKPLATFAQVAEMYLTAHAPSWRSETHRRQWRQTLDDYVLPTLGTMGVAAIAVGDVMGIVEPLWHAKPETASRVRGRIESLLDYATARGWRQGDNPARWRGHLANLLPARGKVAAVEHHAAMPWQDLPAFLTALAERSGTAAKALAFTILTGARSGEARGATWGEMDLGAAIWTIPAARMKGGREHRIPLSGAALDVLQEAATLRQDGTLAALVFPGASGAKPLSDVAVAKLLPSRATVHGMRSAFRDWAGETTNYPREVVEMALAHRIGDAVEQAYARGDLFQRRKRLMDAWASYCTAGTPAETGAVVPIRQGA
jgi:integrase